jgi:hypothetical protein
MKCLSLKQPWADLIANGVKTIETRTWRTKYRGDIVIVSSIREDTGAYLYLSKKFPAQYKRLLEISHKSRSDIYGAALCVAKLVNCRPMNVTDQPAACCLLYEGAWAWELANIRPMNPITIKGQLSLFEAEVPGVCHICGCTDLAACEGGCSWVNKKHTVCSNCS